MQHKTELITNNSSSQARPLAELLDVQDVAGLLKCSPRTVYRMVYISRIPKPIKLGALVRWRRSELLTWLDAGCLDAGTDKGIDHE